MWGHGAAAGKHGRERKTADLVELLVEVGHVPGEDVAVRGVRAVDQHL